jgi:hypothetical protein
MCFIIARELEMVIHCPTIVLSAYGRYNLKPLEYATLKQKRLQDRIRFTPPAYALDQTQRKFFGLLTICSATICSAHHAHCEEQRFDGGVVDKPSIDFPSMSTSRGQRPLWVYSVEKLHFQWRSKNLRLTVERSFFKRGRRRTNAALSNNPLWRSYKRKVNRIFDWEQFRQKFTVSAVPSFSTE